MHFKGISALYSCSKFVCPDYYLLVFASNVKDISEF
jgi:hypothetical protein